MAIGTPTDIGTANSASASTTYTLTTSASVTAGNTIIVGFGTVSQGTGAATYGVSGGGLTWVEDQVAQGIESDRTICAIWSAPAPAGLASSTNLTIARTVGSTTAFGIATGAMQVSGIGVKDVGNGQFRAAPTGSWSALTATTTVADTLVVGCAFADGITSSVATSGTELHDVNQVTNSWATTTTYAIHSTTGSKGATGTWNTTPSFADAASFVAYGASGTTSSGDLVHAVGPSMAGRN